jgi:LytS/YehU family sensor histidine kinase
MYILKNDAENASRYLNKFAKLVRLILNQSDEVYVPLGKEIEMLKYYIELEKLRFDIPFSHNIEVDASINLEETEIPSMLLQPYVENAIQHGLRHKKGNRHLSVLIHQNENGLLCIIEDNGVGRKQAALINASRPGIHDSKGSILTAERLAMLGTEQNRPVVNIVDPEDEKPNVTGTRVEINIPVEFN